jgi:hypothetical protein
VAIYPGKISHLEFGGVDLSSFVTDLDVELEPWQHRFLEGLPSGSITIDFGASQAYDAWWAAWDRVEARRRERRRQRLSHMRTAYHRRRR